MFPTRIPVVWHLNHNSALPWHKVTTDGSLVLLHVDHSAQGNYSCYDYQGHLLHSVKLRLGRKCCWDLSGLEAPNFGVITLRRTFCLSPLDCSFKKMHFLKQKEAVIPCVLVLTSSQSLSVQFILWIIQHKRSFGSSYSDILISHWNSPQHIFYHVSLSYVYFCL